MKLLVFLLATVSAVQLEYNEFEAPPAPIWSVIKRGDVRDFADANVEKAMKANKSSGNWPISNAPPDPIYPPKHRLAKDHWETIVKKGNAAFSDQMVEKALKSIPEPIVIGGKVQTPIADAEKAAEEAAKADAEEPRVEKDPAA